MPANTFARLAIALIVSFVLGGIGWLTINNAYPPGSRGPFASKEAKESLEVTPAQTKELENSERLTDLLCCAFLGGLIAAASGAISHPQATVKSRVIGTLVGVVLGSLAGLIGGFLSEFISIPEKDAMLYWCGRWALVLAPVGVCAALAAAISGGKLAKDVSEAVVGAVLGAVVATLLYTVLAGTVTPMETKRTALFPARGENRLMSTLLSTVCVVVGITTTLGAHYNKNREEPSPETSQEGVE